MNSVLIPLGAQVLALTREEFAAALKRGEEIMGTSREERVNRQEVEGLLSAEETAKAVGVPKAWLLEAARQGRVPHYRLGKYVRFRLSEVATCNAMGVRNGA